MSEGTGYIRELVEAGDYEEGLKEVGRIKGIMSAHSLGKLKCLKAVTGSLEEYERLCAGRLCQEFVDGCGRYDRGNVEVNFALLPKGRVLKETGDLKAVSEVRNWTGVEWSEGAVKVANRLPT